MGPQIYTYFLNNPKTRPNPFRIGSAIVFVDGVWTAELESRTIGEADKMLSAYGASREVPEWAFEEGIVKRKEDVDDGVSDNEPDGSQVSGGKADTESEVPSDGETTEEENDEGGSDAESDAGDAGSGSGEESGEGATDKSKRPTQVEAKPKRGRGRPKKETETNDLA